MLNEILTVFKARSAKKFIFWELLSAYCAWLVVIFQGILSGVALSLSH